MSDNGHRDDPPPPASSRLTFEAFAWNWHHDAEGRVILHLTPMLAIDHGDGNVQRMRDGTPVALVFSAEGWDNFTRDVKRGGHSSPVAIAKQVPGA